MLKRMPGETVRRPPDRVRNNIKKSRQRSGVKLVSFQVGEVINLRTQSSAKAVYVGRGSPYGNPFRVGKDGSRDEVIEKFIARLLYSPGLVQMIRDNLKGETLGCFCAPKRCHAHVLAWVAAGGEPEDFSF